MRLTLRTLLAYLDDTMDPAEIKQFGQRVGESETAQELIARIRQITRRRRLTVPPTTGPGAFDPNTVAEYLDNELHSDQVAELEKTCLESDVHLAEIAASHQILTLVLGQPALVPPMARERMYSLVQGREAIPFRKVAVPIHEASHLDEDDYDPSSKESGLLTMPIFRRPKPWLRWVIPTAAVVLLIGVGYALMQALPGHRGQLANKTKDPDKEGRVALKDGGNPEPKPSVPTPPKVEETGEPKKKPEEPGETTQPKPPLPKDPTPVVVPPTVTAGKKPAPPSTERTDVGIYQSLGPPSILLQQSANGWKRLAPDKAVYTNEPLVSLPGFASEILLNTQVHLLLRGNIPEFAQDPIMAALMDSAVILHATKEFDLDLTLLRGRIFISIGDRPADKLPAKVRLRFENEVWDLTLKEPRTEIGVDLLRLWTRDSDWKTGQPRTEAYLCVLHGEVDMRVDTYHHILLNAPPGQAVYTWNNEGPGDNQGQLPIGPKFLSELPLIWSKDPPIAQWKKKLSEEKEKFASLPADQSRDAKGWIDYLGPRIKLASDMEMKLKDVSKNMVGPDKPISVMLMEGCQPSRDPAERLLCIYAMGALDEVGRLFDVLFTETPSAAPDRDAAILMLRRWISRGPDQTKKLYHDDITGKGGILLDGNRFTPHEANIVITLLHDFSTEDSHKRETFELLSRYLSSEKLPIRELAYWHLRRLAQGVNLEPFDTLAPKEVRAAWIEKLDKMIEEGKLPPRSQDPVPAPKK